MAIELLIAVAAYAFISSATPGPNNFMLLASGANFGFVRTIPHMLGITTGFFVLLVAVGLGLGALLTAIPALHLALKIAGSVYLLYLAWRIATSHVVNTNGKATARPMTLLEAAVFQWVNPKAWVVALTAMAIYADVERPFLSVFAVGLVFASISLMTVSIWAGFGVTLRRFLSEPARLKWFNIAMGILLALTLGPLLT